MITASVLHDFRYPDAERYRNLPEAQIVRFLCSPFELARGNAGPETEAMQCLLHHLIATGLPFRQHSDGSRRFDLAELVNFVKYAHYAWGEAVWLERGVATMRRLALAEDTGIVPTLPPDLEQRPPRRYAVTITRRFDTAGLRAGAMLRLNMPKPLNPHPGSHRLNWLRTDGASQPPVDEGSRYCIKAKPDGRGEIVIALRHEFIPASGVTTAETSAPSADLYLRPREGLVVITPRIVSLAKQLGLDAADPRQSVRRIWDYLFDEISFGFIHYDRLLAEDPLAWGLDNRRVDCRTGSALIVALCRAVGIPARMINGYTLHPALATTHSWAEIWLGDDGWRPFDTYTIDLAGGEHNSPWRQHFFGQVDQRFVAEVLPMQFCGLGTPRLPAHWQLATALTDEGATTWFHSLDNGALIYSETVAVELV